MMRLINILVQMKSLYPYTAILILFCMLSGPLKGIAQEDSILFHPVTNKALQKWDIRKISVAADGKLWLSTGNGVASFDGTDVRFFGQSDKAGRFMHNRSISRCYFDSSGNLFCLLSGGDISYLHIKSGLVERLNIYIQSEDSSAFYFPIPYTEMLIDKNNLWVGRTNMGFMCYDLETKQTKTYSIYNDKTHTTVTSIRKDLKMDRILWLGTNNGIYSFNKKTGELKRYFRCSNVADSSSEDVNILKMDISYMVHCYRQRSGML
jgi:ligand-binding sensor domain-containing protein